MEHQFVCGFVCAVLGLPRAFHMLEQSQAFLELRTGLGKLKTGQVYPCF